MVRRIAPASIMGKTRMAANQGGGGKRQRHQKSMNERISSVKWRRVKPGKQARI